MVEPGNSTGKSHFYGGITGLSIVVLIAALVVDSLSSDVSSILNQSLPESTRITWFSTIVALAVISGMYALLWQSSEIRTGLRPGNVLVSISRIIPFIQFIITGLLILITLQIVFASEYFTALYVSLLVLSWSTGVILMGIMAFKFIRWYRARKNALVLLHTISSLLFCSTLGATIIPQSMITLETSSLVSSKSAEVKPFQANPQQLDTLLAIISIANWLVLPLVFVIWTATAVMLNSYSRKFGRGKFWVIVSAPLVSVIVGVLFLLVFLSSLTSIFDERVIPYTMMAFGGILTEGFLLGFAFMIIRRSVGKMTQGKIIDYLRTSGIGTMILFVSFFSNPSAGSYLPFGVVASSFFGVGSYLFLAGIYSTAISISSDMTLRQAMRKALLDKSRILDNIGEADMYVELQKQTEDMAKKYKQDIEGETGIASSISESDMKSYIKEVMVEIRKNKGEAV